MRSAILAACALVGLTAVGCNNTEPSTIYVEASWKVRCPDTATLPDTCAAGCTPGQDRVIQSFTGENGTNLSCSVVETSTQRILDFDFLTSDGPSLQVQNLALPISDAAVSAASGRVIVNEANTFQGAAGASEPSNEQPCQVSNVVFSIDPDSMETLIEGDIYCELMRAPADSRLCRGLSDVGGSGTANVPAHFEIYSCSGLSL